MGRWNEVVHNRGICIWDVAVCSDAGNIHDLFVLVEMNISISAFKMYLTYLPMCGCATRVQVPSRPAEGAGVPGVGVTGGSESLR